MFSIIQPLFLQKTKPIYLGFEFGQQRIRVSVVRAHDHENKNARSENILPDCV